MPQKFAPLLLTLFLFTTTIALAQSVQQQHLSPSKANTQERLQGNVKVAEMMQEAEHMTQSGNEAEALELWITVTEADPTNQRALNRASFLSSRIGNRLDGAEQDKYYWQAKRYAEQSLDVNRNNADANFAMAVAMGRIAEVAPARDRLEASRRIRQFAEKALELDSNHAGAWHVLGLWHFRMSSMSVAEREAAKALYGANASGANGASKAEAVRSIRKAIELNPDYLLYRSDLARVYFAQGEREKAKQELRTIMQMHSTSPDDEAIKKNAQSKL